MVRSNGWQPDVLGRGYEQLTLALADDSEGEVVATLVRRRGLPLELPGHGPAHGIDVLYVHGWSDYFFQTHLADYWHEKGARFFALDLRKYGRSLRPHQTPGFVTDLNAYDEDIEAALGVMGHSVHDDLGGRSLVLMGHSTGGLTLSLWAARHPHRTRGVVLNSAWLEFQASALGRQAIAPLTRAEARLNPRASMPNVDLGFYTRAVSQAAGDGEWEYDDAWRPARGFPVHPAWLSAIFSGQARVAAGLDIQAPVLSMMSDRSTIAPRWSAAMRSSDSVLVVDDIAARSLKLGATVTVARIPGALHDVMLSALPAREAAMAAITRWLSGYAPN
ncbi:alpha/beta hydrolase [Leifsonia sp. Leaf325]|nr:alpha/beta hydrolase [Leifsonia sp. Leaf325]KQQ92964.1 alpha/beta hydrolase [Leifsonia sp. Leaf325]